MTSPGYNLHFTERVSGALTPLETLPHRSFPWSFGRDVASPVRKEKAEIRLSLRNEIQRHEPQFRKEHGLSYVWCDWFLGKRVKFEVHCGAPAPGVSSGRLCLYFRAPPVSDPHNAAKVPSGGGSVLFLSHAISLIPERIPNPF